MGAQSPAPVVYLLTFSLNICFHAGADGRQGTKERHLSWSEEQVYYPQEKKLGCQLTGGQPHAATNSESNPGLRAKHVEGQNMSLSAV
jgi:hypothetical protein